MLNKVLLTCNIVSNYWLDQYNNLFFKIAIIDDEPYTQVNGENRYSQNIIVVALHSKLHQYFLSNCFLGQKLYTESRIISVDNKPIILIEQIQCLEIKNGYMRKTNGFKGE